MSYYRAHAQGAPQEMDAKKGCNQGDRSFGWKLLGFAKWIAHATLSSSPFGHSCFAAPPRLNQDWNGGETTQSTVECMIHFAKPSNFQPHCDHLGCNHTEYKDLTKVSQHLNIKLLCFHISMRGKTV